MKTDQSNRQIEGRGASNANITELSERVKLLECRFSNLDELKKRLLLESNRDGLTRRDYHAACYYSAIVSGLSFRGKWNEDMRGELLRSAADFAAKAIQLLDNAGAGE